MYESKPIKQGRKFCFPSYCSRFTSALYVAHTFERIMSWLFLHYKP